MGRAIVGEPVDIDGTPGTLVDMGNPHVVVHVGSVDALGMLDPTRKDLVAGLKFLWENISLSAGGDGTLSEATITYHQLAQ